jgi:hypothetical protein
MPSMLGRKNFGHNFAHIICLCPIYRSKFILVDPIELRVLQRNLGKGAKNLGTVGKLQKTFANFQQGERNIIDQVEKD